MAARVVIADDSRFVRDGLRRLLGKYPDIQIVGEASNGVEALECNFKLAPDILLLDIAMPIMDGLGVLRELSKRKPKTKVIVLSAYDDEQFIQGAINLGAAGYLLKEDALSSLVEVIRRVNRGERGFFRVHTPQVQH